jgi:hypothetical protein
VIFGVFFDLLLLVVNKDKRCGISWRNPKTLLLLKSDDDAFDFDKFSLFVGGISGFATGCWSFAAAFEEGDC